jgi:hypothetical protein
MSLDDSAQGLVMPVKVIPSPAQAAWEGTKIPTAKSFECGRPHLPNVDAEVEPVEE